MVSEELDLPLDLLIKHTMETFEGDIYELEKALGILHLGLFMGWEVIRLIHGKHTIRKYEEILGFSLREALDPAGEYSHCSLGYQLAGQNDNYWKMVKGEVSRELVSEYDATLPK